MTAPAGHVTVFIVAPLVTMLQAVEYSCPGEGVTDGLAGREADTERLDDGDTDTDDTRLGVAERDREGVTLRPRDTDGDSDGSREGVADGLADALTILHCT